MGIAKRPDFTSIPPPVVGLAALCLMATVAWAAGPSGGLWNTIDAGGARSTGGGLTVTGTIGQSDAGRLARHGFVLRGGYWGGGAVATSIGVPDTPQGQWIFRLHPVHPNPFNPATTIAFDLPETGPVDIQVLNLRGERVATLVHAEMPAGRHQVTWRGLDHRGAAVASGVYLLALEAGVHRARTKLTLVR